MLDALIVCSVVVCAFFGGMAVMCLMVASRDERAKNTPHCFCHNGIYRGTLHLCQEVVDHTLQADRQRTSSDIKTVLRVANQTTQENDNGYRT